MNAVAKKPFTPWFGVLFLFAILFALPVSAQTFSMSVACTSVGQTCTPLYSTGVTVGTPGPLTITITASAGHCSNVKYLVSVDGTSIGETPFLTPGQTGAPFVTSTLSTGAHTITVQGVGTVGGCNVGTLGGWSGTLAVAGTGTPTIPAAPIPSSLLLMFIGLTIVAAIYFKSRNASAF